MKAIIIFFSPSGNTRKVARQMANVFTPRFSKVELIDLTHNESYLNSVQFRENLYLIINQFDVICVGSPVYAHHMHYNVLAFIRGLKPVDNRIQYAVPFVTYGGINSGEALHDAEKLLRSSGRKVVAGLKVNSEHCLSKPFKTDFNRNLPGESAIPYLEDLAEMIISQSRTNKKSNGYFLNYQKPGVRIRTRLLIGEKFWHKHMYPAIVFDHSKCKQCGRCADRCPLMRINSDGYPVIEQNAPDCIHCGMCVFTCRNGGAYFDTDMVKWEKLFIKATLGKGPLVSNEEPRTQVYYSK